jgi:hypothetical protein
MPVWLRRLFGRGELRRGPCYPEMRAAAERVCGDLSLRGEPLCEQCAGQQVRRAAWWRLVYSVIGRHRCAACGREFGVTRRATGTAELAATEMDAVWPVPGCPFDEPQQEARRCVAR